MPSQVLASPACKIRHQDVGSEMKFRFDQYLPTSGSTTAVVVRRHDNRAQRDVRACMSRRRSRGCPQLPIDDLGDQMIGDAYEIFVCRRTSEEYLRHVLHSTSSVATSLPRGNARDLRGSLHLCALTAVVHTEGCLSGEPAGCDRVIDQPLELVELAGRQARIVRLDTVSDS